EQKNVVDAAEVLAALLRVTVAALTLPDDFVLEVVLPQDLVEHYLDVMTRVPVAVVVEASRFLEYAGQFHAPWPHVADVCLRGTVPVLEGAGLLGLAPEHFVVPVAVERRVNVDQVNAFVG